MNMKDKWILLSILILETEIQNDNQPRNCSYNDLFKSLWVCMCVCVCVCLVGLLMHSQSFKLDIGQVLAHNLYY